MPLLWTTLPAIFKVGFLEDYYEWEGLEKILF